jgi:MarR family transcriptional regulator, organic hydroperoxide resistance regulator
VSLPLGGVLEFLRLVWGIDHRLQRASKRMERELGVTGAQRFTLRLIGRFPGITPGRLADAVEVHPSTMSGILKRLERRKLVVRRTDPNDARRWFLALTETGRALNLDPRGTVEGAVESVLADLPAGKVAIAREVLGELSRALDDAPELKRASGQ